MKNNQDLNKVNKKNTVVIAMVIIVFVLAIIGISYAFFTYSKTGEENSKLIAGQIYLKLSEGTDSISLATVFPMSAEEARKNSNNVLKFSISGVNTTKNKDIYYEIKLNEGNDINGMSRFNPKDLRFDLTEIIDGQRNLVIDNKSFQDFNDRRIWVNTVNHDTNDEVNIEYELRMWLSDDVLISDTLPDASYTTGEYRNSYANVKIAVFGDFTEKEVVFGTPIVDKIKSLVGTNGLVAVNTDGALASEGDTIREYRYSGPARYCTYNTDGGLGMYVAGDSCPNICMYISTQTFHVSRSDSEWYIYFKANGNCSAMGGTEFPPNENTPLIGDVKNYIWYNDEMWRIIGVFDEITGTGTSKEMVKIIRDDALLLNEVPTTYTYNGIEMNMKPTSLPGGLKYAPVHWNSSNYFNQTNDNDWTKASLQYYLNDATPGANSYYNSISGKYQQMIENVVYHLGNTVRYNNAANSYIAERSGNISSGNQTTWTGKIGLMYYSDYGYGVLPDVWSIATIDMYDNSYGLSNWMMDSVRAWEWTISPLADDVTSSYNVGAAGPLPGVTNFFHPGTSFAVSPVLYLKSDVLTTEGDGSYDNPYKLDM